MKYRVEIWINNGSASNEMRGNDKIKLLKEGMALIRECHTPLPGHTSSITLYRNNIVMRDCFLTNDKTYFKHFYGSTH